ncbi:hypothetical protein H5410_051168 [Solanum commersonii]|uniref:Uncharacterized protein n=1 Tax=Solanum commersonii TaxID=4109 RepID=A0A9J5WZ80_SOLCO|nr:hypothetical protein H5410_051168 [Solanum commersonii]
MSHQSLKAFYQPKHSDNGLTRDLASSKVRIRARVLNLFHVLQLADHKRQARPFILSLDAQILSSPKECLPKKEEIRCSEENTENREELEEDRCYPAISKFNKSEVLSTIRHKHLPCPEPHLLSGLIVQDSWSEEGEPHRAGLAWKEGYPKSLFRNLVRVSSILMALPDIVTLLTMSKMGSRRQPTTETCFALARLTPTCLLPTIVKDLSLHHSRNLTSLLGQLV